MTKHDEAAARLRLFNEVMARPARKRDEPYYCRCGHTLKFHDIRHEDKGCDVIGCPCLEYRPPKA